MNGFLHIFAICGLCLLVISQDLHARRPKLSTEVDTVLTAVPLKRIEFSYPPAAARACINGDVHLSIQLSLDGTPVNVKVDSCTAPGNGFEKAASNAARKAFFLPLSYFGRTGDSSWSTYVARFRCYNGLIATYSAPRLPFDLDTIPDPPEDLWKKFKSNHTGHSSVTILNADSTRDTAMSEGDVLINCRCNQSWEVIDGSILFSTLHDSAPNAIALQCITDGSLIPRADSSTKSAGSLIVRVAFRRHQQNIEAQEPDTTADSIEVAPEVISKEMPSYPGSAVKRGREGTVWVLALVNSKGNVDQAELSHSCGYPELDEAAVAAALRYKYKPAEKNGRKVPVWVTYRVDFKLNP